MFKDKKNGGFILELGRQISIQEHSNAISIQFFSYVMKEYIFKIIFTLYKLTTLTLGLKNYTPILLTVDG